MKTTVFILFLCLSVAVMISFLIISFCLYKKGKRAKRVLSSIQIFTIGVFMSVVLIYIPIYYFCYDFGDSLDYVRPCFISIHNALRIFILDGDFDIIVNSLSGQSEPLRIVFTSYVAFLYVIAPVLTFSNVLSLFKNIKDEIRYKWHRLRKHYIMSEINEKSVALAKSIYEKNKKAVIVFTDVFEQNEDRFFELIIKARDINAICLKRDIAHLYFLSKKGDVEIFLIGKDESENVSQAVNITTELNKANKKQNVKIFVFSSKPGSGHIIDSIKYEKLSDYAFQHREEKSYFKIRRINEKQQLIWNTVPEMEVFDIAARHNNTLSVLIVGFGSYGRELFKMLLWFCQLEGYKLQINIVDKSHSEHNYMKSVIDKECPELLKKNRCKADGEAYYDIELFGGIDATTSEIDELLSGDKAKSENDFIAERFKLTNLVFVSLGDDDLNIQTSIQLRSLFDRIHKINAGKDIKWRDETVNIYSIVYDDNKSRLLESGDPESNILWNHKKIPYHIHFIGGMSSQFSYENIYNENLEEDSYKHHRDWAEVEKEIEAEMKQNHKNNIDKQEWSYCFYDFEDNKKSYEQYEYNRQSSIAKALYKRELNKYPFISSVVKCKEDNKRTCCCENCIRRKKSEHMRWNAYIRVAGYSYAKNKSDRAMYHDKLREWDELPELEKQKD